jgi:hypothetical protein
MRLRLAIRAMMIVVLAAALPAVGARADYPDQTVKVVVPFPAGGFMDVVARIASDRLAAILGNPVVVENRAGAGGNRGVRSHLDNIAMEPAPRTDLEGARALVSQQIEAWDNAVKQAKAP